MIRIFHRTCMGISGLNKTLLQWQIEIDIFAQGRFQSKVLPRKEPNECPIVS